MVRRVSIVIPVLNDAQALTRCLAALKDEMPSTYEIIVCDGGGDAACAEIARKSGARYCASAPGRAVQMNAGAELASGEWLWFLHADCVPARGSIDALTRVDPRRAWGCFRHRIDAPGVLLRVIESADNFRARLMRLPYGDQGLFVRRDVFRELGGFANVPVLEDVVLARMLAEFGAPRVLHPLLRTDARRWLRHGVMKTTWMNWRVMWMYLVTRRDIGDIAAYYRGGRSPGSAPNERSTSSVSDAT